MFSEAVTAEAPARLLSITGQWEGMLRAEALRTLQLVDPAAQEGQTAVAGEVVRRAVVAPHVEHVGVLYSATGLAEARAFLNDAFARDAGGTIAATGPWIALSFAGLLLLAWPMAGLLPRGKTPRELTPLEFWIAALIPAVAAPLLAATVDSSVLPVLVADYLALHLFVYGVLLIIILKGFGFKMGRMDGLSLVVLLLYGIVLFGGFLETYVAAFMPSGPRPLLILAIAAGAVPFMIGETRLLEAGHAPIWRTLVARGAFLASLGVAVALDFEGLFFC